MALSVCLITRDAAASLDRVLRSVAGLGAEVLVADTGSTDGTVEAARALGARAEVIPWHDDFGAAQNAALDLATGDWVLWLNPDEELLPHRLDQLPAMLAQADALAYVVRVQQVTDPAQPGRAMETAYPRLFRRLPEVRFVGRVHPHFAPPLDDLARQRGQQLYRADLIVRHHAYASALTEDKLRWATRLLKRELQDRPGQLHYEIEYGRNLLLLNDPAGHDVLAAAADRVLAAADAPTAPSATVASLLEYLLTVSPEQARSRLGRDQARQLAEGWFPASPPLLWAMAQADYEAGHVRAAADRLERLLELGQTGTYDRSAAFDARVIGEQAVFNLGHCYLRLGDADRAEHCFLQLATSPAYQAQARQGYLQAQQMRGRTPPA